MMTHDTLTRLTVGTPAPIFQTQDIFGQPIDLAAYAGRTVLLSFFRNGACAICNLQVNKLIQQYPVYHAKGLEILAVFEVDKESIQQYVGKQDAPFPIIADPTAHLYDLYQVETSHEKVEASMATPLTQGVVEEAAEKGFPLIREENTNFYRMPADFLIGPDGTLQRVFYSEIVGQHLPFTEIEQVLTA
ncbi:MAG: redoxin domain-containing protein [Chitinophagaceae bacterium]|nr:redoxin domain-containing protein [Anaerolineae bacterium]